MDPILRFAGEKQKNIIAWIRESGTEACRRRALREVRELAGDVD